MVRDAKTRVQRAKEKIQSPKKVVMTKTLHFVCVFQNVWLTGAKGQMGKCWSTDRASKVKVCRCANSDRKRKGGVGVHKRRVGAVDRQAAGEREEAKQRQNMGHDGHPPRN